jgi:hypothetical protein
MLEWEEDRDDGNEIEEWCRTTSTAAIRKQAEEEVEDSSEEEDEEEEDSSLFDFIVESGMLVSSKPSQKVELAFDYDAWRESMPGGMSAEAFFASFGSSSEGEEEEEEDEDNIRLVNDHMRKEYSSISELDEVSAELGIEDCVRVEKTALGCFRPVFVVAGGSGGRDGRRMARGRRRKKRPNVHRVRVPRATVLAPDKVVVPLQFRSEFILQGTYKVARRFHSNCLFDVDPALGGLAINGFSTWSTLYSFNRVQRFRVQANFTNLEAVPITLETCHLNTDPGLSPVSYTSYATQAYGGVFQVPANAVNSFRYRKSLMPENIVGDKMTFTSERYVGSSAANPADATYFGMCVTDPVGALPNGVVVSLTMTFIAEFFDRKNLDDTSTVEERQREFEAEDAKRKARRSSMPKKL